MTFVLSWDKSYVLFLKEDILWLSVFAATLFQPTRDFATFAVGATEVWSYLSTDGYGVRTQDSFKVTSYYSTKPSTYEKRFCTVNVVMKDGVVRALHYLGPTGTTILNNYDQCGYAVAACVE